MAGNRPKTLTGQKDWSQTLGQLRQALALGITERRISDEFFVFDLLKGVYEDGVEERTRIEILIFLEEYSSLLVEQENVEQVQASLLDIFHQSLKTGSSVPFTCQVLTSLITVLIEFDQLGKSLEVCEQIVTTLLTLTSQVNDTTDLLLRSHACNCLLELENNYPTVLQNKLHCLYLLVKSEFRWLYQDYVNLFTTTLKHTLTAMVNCLDSPSENKLTDMLSNRKEQMRDCPNLKTKFLSQDFLESLSLNQCFDESVEAREVRQIVSLVLENSLVFTPAGLCSIVENLIVIVCQIPALSPIVFKPLVLQHMSTMDLSLLQLIFKLRRTFPNILLSEPEEMSLVNQFVVSLNHHGYTAAHRLLLYEWFFQYDSPKQSSNEDSLPVRLTEANYYHLFPSVFDGVDTQVAKLRALNLCINPGPESDLASAVLMSSLVNLHKTVQHNSSGRAAVALLRVLYIFHKKHINSSLPQDIKKFVIGLVSNSIQLVPHVINFMDALKQIPESGDVYLEILSALHRQVIQAQSEDIDSQLEYILEVLKKSATEKQINPRMTLDFVQRLLDCAPLLLQGDWGYGNAVLSVGKNLLQFHSTDVIFHDMGRLFHTLMTDYPDVDIKDKAMFYYALLTGAADEKIQLVLNDSTVANSSSNNIHNIVSGPGGILNQMTLTELDKSPVCWKRFSLNGVWSPRLPEERKQPELDKLDTVAEAVKAYLAKLPDYSPSLECKYRLRMVDNCDFDQLLALTIQTNLDKNWQPVKDVPVSCLLASEEKEITLNLRPKLPLPGNFPVTVMFTCSDARTIFAHLTPLDVTFRDFFFPLPLSFISEGNTEQVFDALWEEIVGENDINRLKDDSRGVQSVYIPQCGMIEMGRILQTQLAEFLVKSDSTALTYLVGIFLPARYHLLMKIRQVEDRVVIQTATDSWESLACLHRFLDDLCNGRSLEHT